MFRVPFLMGSQEGLKRRPRGGASEGQAEGEEARQSPPSSPRSTTNPASSADPWGLERSGANAPALGQQEGGQVAQLGHIRLARQAMVHWQTYDAFARISLCIG